MKACKSHVIENRYDKSLKYHLNHKNIFCLGRMLHRNSDEQDCIDLLQISHAQDERRASIESCV